MNPEPFNLGYKYRQALIMSSQSIGCPVKCQRKIAHPPTASLLRQKDFTFEISPAIALNPTDILIDSNVGVYNIRTITSGGGFFVELRHGHGFFKIL
jgi:hypothetical protein